MPGSRTENSTIVRFSLLSALAVTMAACAATPRVSHERAACGARERLVCESSAGGRRCACTAESELERVFGSLGARID
jgi:hypothetical protein